MATSNGNTGLHLSDNLLILELKKQRKSALDQMQQLLIPSSLPSVCLMLLYREGVIKLFQTTIIDVST